MTDTPFKVGETYKTRDGREAVLIARNDDKFRSLLWSLGCDERWTMSSTFLDGRCVPSVNGPEDILPPRRGVWVAVDVETGEPFPGAGASAVEPQNKAAWNVIRRGEDARLVWRFFVEAEPQP